MANEYVTFFNIETSSEITTDKLPSNLDVIKLLFYYIRDLNQHRQESAQLVYEKVVEYWNDVGIQTRRKGHCINKI